MDHTPTPRPEPYQRPTSARRPVSQRRYAMRRLGALVVVALVVAGLVRGGSAAFDALFRSDGTTEASDGGIPSSDPPSSTLESDDPSTSSLDQNAAAAATPSSEAPASSAAPVVEPPAVPSAADPAVVLILGDSDAGTFGPYLDQLLGETGVVTTELDYKVSSGLSRPDFFDWPTHLRELVPTIDPDIIVATFGGNDAQGLFDVAGNVLVGQPTGDGDDEWRQEYGRRVLEVMDFLTQDGRKLVWVGIPNDDNPEVTARMQVQDEVVRAAIAMRPQVSFVDTWARFSGRSGGWAEYLVDPRDGQGKDVRADDGFHLNQDGAEILAIDIAEVVKAELRARGAAI
jgi:uncharacterized protein